MYCRTVATAVIIATAIHFNETVIIIGATFSTILFTFAVKVQCSQCIFYLLILPPAVDIVG